jgi:hypothetical protein
MSCCLTNVWRYGNLKDTFGICVVDSNAEIIKNIAIQSTSVNNQSVLVAVIFSNDINFYGTSIYCSFCPTKDLIDCFKYKGCFNITYFDPLNKNDECGEDKFCARFDYNFGIIIDLFKEINK